jgi:hypothetical protein
MAWVQRSGIDDLVAEMEDPRPKTAAELRAEERAEAERAERDLCKALADLWLGRT